MTSSQSKGEIARQRKAQSIPWIANPFSKHEHSKYHPVPTTSGGKVDINPGGDIHIETLDRENLQEKLEEEHEIEEATPIELFYDLFFVANLTTVTSVHYITEWESLTSYILFFIILWFTWLHVTLVDVRYSVDSVFERVCKALHFATMAGFSSVSTNWDPQDPNAADTYESLRIMTLALMFSRFVLGFQYFVVMFFGRAKKNNTVVPLAIQGTAMIVSAAVYLGLFFSFGKTQTTKSYVVWYVMAVFEVVAVIGTSSIWKNVNFSKTHLVERLGLLTLIILGEGIIVMLKAINTIVKGYGWSKSIIGVVIAALLIIYFFWMFYFDYTPKDVHYGSIRQQIWALLHFPFHLAIVLSVEGLRQLTTAYNFQLLATYLINLFVSPDPNIPLTGPDFAGQFNYTFGVFYDDGSSKSVMKDWDKIMKEITELDALGEVTTENAQQLSDLLSTLLYRMINGLAEYLGIKVPYKKYKSPDDQMLAVVQVFDLVYQYFFLSLGVIFLMYSVFAVLVRSRSKMDIFDAISILLRFCLAVAFFGMVALRTNGVAYDNYTSGPWAIPQVCLMIFVVLVVDKMVNSLAIKRAK